MKHGSRYLLLLCALLVPFVAEAKFKGYRTAAIQRGDQICVLENPAMRRDLHDHIAAAAIERGYTMKWVKSVRECTYTITFNARYSSSLLAGEVMKTARFRVLMGSKVVGKIDFRCSRRDASSRLSTQEQGTLILRRLLP